MARERPGQTLQPTALVNEVYLRLVDIRRMHWQNLAQFFAIAARLMRRVLVDVARSRRYQKRGGGARKVSLDAALLPAVQPATDIVALDDALKALSEMDPRKGQVVELRFFGGLSVEETADVLGISSDTVTRDWKLAKIWLQGQLKALETVVALRVSLDDSTETNGPLRVLPGSHRSGVLSDQEIGRLAAETRPVDCVAASGGVVAMRPLTVHASSKSTDDRPRRVLHIEYAEYAASVHLGAGVELAAG